MTKNPVNFDNGDDLGDLLGGAAPAAPAAPTSLPQGDTWERIRSYADKAPAAEAFQITCPKCKGSGAFVSYSGRRVGDCFHCKGAGKLSRKTNPVQLARAKERRVEQANAIREEAAPQIAWLVKTLGRNGLPEGYADILRNCLEGLQAGRILSPGRQGVVDRGMERDAAYAAKRAAPQAQAEAPRASAPNLNFPGIRAAFDAVVAKGAKRAQMTVGELNLSLAPSTGNNAGGIYVKVAGTYMGKIMGTLLRQGRDATPELLPMLMAVELDPTAAVKAQADRTAERLAKHAADTAAAKAAGKPAPPPLTLPCGCCGIILTDPVSIARGIGPICADKWGF